MSNYSYKVKDLKIEFFKYFFKQYNTFYTNELYDHYPIPGTDGTYLPVQFSKGDPLTYIKIKNRNLWLFGDPNTGKLYFDYLKCGDFGYKQPLVLWLYYITRNKFILFGYTGYGLDHVSPHFYMNSNNVVYVNYSQIANSIRLNWTKDRNSATIFQFDIIQTGDLMSYY